ncbi:MAG: FAD-dependent oxidoreductase, partial [Halobacteriovoraceae bacterium]|nr:FAD-dependent oxidoreductase [Halobacteriovoraceae bacterium]
MADLKVAIIGAGIIGLQIARELIEQGESDFAIFEKNIYPGEHSSSRNSGVLHAGIYYPKESLKQKLCVEGNRLWTEVAQNYGISLERTGKYIVSTDESEDKELQRILNFVQEKQVPGIRAVSPQEIKELNNFVEISNAFFSETTGIVSVSEAIKVFKDLMFQKNIPLLLDQGVQALSKKERGFELVVGEDVLTAETVINCAGLEAISIRKMLGLLNFENYWVKGRYLKLNKPFYTDSL